MIRILSMNTDSKIALITVTKKAKELAKVIKLKLGAGDIYTTSKLCEKGTIEISPSLSEMTGELFKQYDTLIFIMATGIVVRMIAPYLQDKFKDPAILVIDEEAKNVISLLSGHIGGANQMTHKLSSLLDANPVITTSTDVNSKAALDNIAKSIDGYIEHFRETVKDINYRLVHEGKIGLYQEEDYRLDTRGFTLLDSLENLEALEKVIYITHKKRIDSPSDKIIKLIPRNLVIGIGCRKDTNKQLLEDSVNHFLEHYNIDTHAIKCLASIDVKAHEKAIIKLAEKLELPFEIVSRAEIEKIEHLFEKSEFVKKNIGVYSVAEPVAYLLSGGNLWIKKHKYQGITFAIGRIKL
ncbi:cobalt-precorrin 5A hydrolase [Cellulosilyticum sp. I15G10I2]|uniref:cobalt-precorrin 5A hydrolase n=1 Tax=Cellulosilyticum sp. I15G10I2 TaxID=1892843 RepID=UPI001FA77270|nr:cobalt-precorrin 5A hydrolase [Cellulosilyticum sp. I15G10I2]